MSMQFGDRALAAGATLESLKKEAKRWRRALCDGDALARERMGRLGLDVGSDVTLRAVQHALAREHGLESWTALKALFADRALARRTDAERAEALLRHAVDRAGGSLAAHILRKHQDMAQFSLCTAVASGDLDEVDRRLTEDRTSASRPDGPMEWQPLQYLRHARVPLAETSAQAVAIARALLDAGADPKATWKDD